jgi:ketosteroid isomerase-like protein
MSARSVKEIFEEHLALVRAGDDDGDIERCYAEDAMVISRMGTFQGRSEIRRSRSMMRQEVLGAEIHPVNVVIEGNAVLLHWTAQNDHIEVHEGEDTYLFRDGRITVQTCHYRVTPRTAGAGSHGKDHH